MIHTATSVFLGLIALSYLCNVAWANKAEWRFTYALMLLMAAGLAVANAQA